MLVTHRVIIAVCRSQLGYLAVWVCLSHSAISRSIAHCLSAIDVSHTPRDLSRCVSHNWVISRYGCVHHTAHHIMVCPSHTARYHGVSVTQRVTDITMPMWCMPPLYFLQHSTSASPPLSYNLINKQASYYSKQGVSCTVGNGTGS